MRFAAPLVLLLLPTVVWLWRRSTSTTDVRRRLLRSAAALALILAASGLEVRSGESSSAVMFAVDRSGSMAGIYARMVDDLQAMTARARQTDQAGIVVFGSSTAIEQPLRQLSAPLTMPLQSTASIGTATNIEASLRVARAALPSGGGRIVLVSDGRDTLGNMVAEATRSAHAGVPIDVVIPEQSDIAPIDVLRVSAPAMARRHEPITITITAHGQPGTSGIATLITPGEAPRTAGITLQSDGYGTATFAIVATDAGIKTYEATVQPQERTELASDPRRVSAVIVVSGEAKALYVGNRAGALAPAIAAAGFELQTIGAAAFPRTASSLTDYDVIVFDDVRPDQLAAAQVGALRGHVERQGGGLFFLGGRDSLDSTLLVDHPLAELLPIDVRPRGGVRSPSLALVVAFDKSGSMDDRVDGVPRIEFARLAVRRVLDAVSPSDAVGVIAFDSSAHAVAPLAPGHDPSMLANQLRDVSPSGATAIAPALELAETWFGQASGFARRHVLLVSDGRTSLEDVARMQTLVAARRFELSIVALGADADRRLLQTLAESTGGRAYFPSDVRELPAIVARESARVAGGQVVETPFPLLSRPHPIVNALGTRTLPQLGGYVVAATRPTAESPLQSPLEDPVLATWRFGLGRVAVYTAELHNQWSSQLRTWNGFQALTRATLQWAARNVRDDLLYANFREESGGLTLTVEAFDRDQPVSALRVRAVIRGPNGDATPLSLAETDLGRYEARFEPTETGVYVAVITGDQADTGIAARSVRGVFWANDAEYRWNTPDIARLTQVAELSGGRILRRGESPFDMPRDATYAPVRTWLALAALVLFLAELLTPFLARRHPLASSGDLTREAAA